MQVSWRKFNSKNSIILWTLNRPWKKKTQTMSEKVSGSPKTFPKLNMQRPPQQMASDIQNWYLIHKADQQKNIKKSNSKKIKDELAIVMHSAHWILCYVSINKVTDVLQYKALQVLRPSRTAEQTWHPLLQCCGDNDRRICVQLARNETWTTERVPINTGRAF